MYAVCLDRSGLTKIKESGCSLFLSDFFHRDDGDRLLCSSLLETLFLPIQGLEMAQICPRSVLWGGGAVHARARVPCSSPSKDNDCGDVRQHSGSHRNRLSVVSSLDVLSSNEFDGLASAKQIV